MVFILIVITARSLSFCQYIYVIDRLDIGISDDKTLITLKIHLIFTILEAWRINSNKHIKLNHNNYDTVNSISIVKQMIIISIGYDQKTIMKGT